MNASELTIIEGRAPSNDYNASIGRDDLAQCVVAGRAPWRVVAVFESPSEVIARAQAVLFISGVALGLVDIDLKKDVA